MSRKGEVGFPASIQCANSSRFVSTRSFFSRFSAKFLRDETTTLAASLAYYTALSLAPLLILFVAISSRLSDQLQAEFLEQARALVGDDGAETLEIVITGAKTRADLTSLAGVIGLFTLLVSASLIFGQLRLALNRIFEVQRQPDGLHGLLGVLWRLLSERLAHIGIALVFIVSLIVSLTASSVLSSSIAAQHFQLAFLLNISISLAFYCFSFTLVFRYLPDRRQPWRAAFQGGVVTSLLFEIGKAVIGIYLGNSAIGSAYGAAGSLIVLLVWVYYSTLITFVGAQVSSILGGIASLRAG